MVEQMGDIFLSAFNIRMIFLMFAQALFLSTFQFLPIPPLLSPANSECVLLPRDIFDLPLLPSF